MSIAGGVRFDLLCALEFAAFVECDHRIHVWIRTWSAAAFGKSAVPGNGAGLPMPQDVVPVAVSIAGGYQAPPPLLTSGFPQRSPSLTVLNDHLKRCCVVRRGGGRRRIL